MAATKGSFYREDQGNLDHQAEAVRKYTKPERHSTTQEANLNLGAHRARMKYLEDVLPGGREPSYVERPQVHVGNWWYRCCEEVPGFVNSLGRRLPDTLTKCSEYKEEFSEYSRFFKNYAPTDIRVPVTKSATESVPFLVTFKHRFAGPSVNHYMSIYSRDFALPPPFQPPYMSGLCDKKRRKWFQDVLDKGTHFCSTYQENYDPDIYEQQTMPLRTAYHNISRENEMDQTLPDTARAFQRTENHSVPSQISHNSAMLSETSPNNAERKFIPTINDVDDLKHSAHKHALAATRV
ncbi:uncharacterized protein LOC129585864 [Paramacrobiotus metropolitanus]|uniref:uncharacterized protein LOC129585864 n=1 Tax=Paramacrobiotus metropolitanus TaxID=2943436 RepID=UPI002445B1F4|nr:uncharacterized protein LOC129585864 [Paramacrobiotus metropolitanus]XP_055334724.1 uncharacterized protein LOC129585864 [Paramacrobiotus metropolitanus]XP_055334725.1 uncharacterized protein LOC129585864 [Paramacrobiotus metropolitanus]